MSETLEEIRRKIHSATELRVVVKTLKVLAAAKSREFERTAAAITEYHKTVELGLGRMIVRSRKQSVRQNATKPTGRRVMIVFGSDIGMVGSFNENIAHFCERIIASEETIFISAVGERAATQLQDLAIRVDHVYPTATVTSAISPLILSVLSDIERDHTLQRLQEFRIAYHKPKSVGGYQPVNLQLLPMDEQWVSRIAATPWPTKLVPEIIGHESRTVEAFIREFFFVSLSKACIESLISENASRLAAMQRAERQIDDSRDEWTRDLNHLRQTAIDNELFELMLFARKF